MPPAEQLSRLAESATTPSVRARRFPGADDPATAGLVAAPGDRSLASCRRRRLHHPRRPRRPCSALENADLAIQPRCASAAFVSPAGNDAARSPAGDRGLRQLAAIATLAERDVGASAGALIGLLEDRRGFYLPLTTGRRASTGALHHYDRDRVQGVLAAFEYDDVVRDALVDGQ
jgi:hypothetical protein